MPQDRPTLSQKHPTRSAMRSPQCTESVLRASISCGVGASRGRFLTHVVRPRGRIPTRPRPRARRVRPGAGAGHLQEQRSLIVTVARLPRSGIFPGMIPRLAPLASAAAACVSVVAAQSPRPTTMAHRSTVYAPHGMIATSQPLATAAGLAVLEHGGNAVDAAVTAAAVLNVTEPMMTGIGGDMFALVWSANDRKLYGLNASGRAGSLMTRDALLARGHRTMPGDRRRRHRAWGALGLGCPAPPVWHDHIRASARARH